MQNIYCTEKILHIGNRSLIPGTCIHIYNTNNDEWILQIRWWVWQLLDFTSLKWNCPSTNKHKYLVVMVSTSITINTNKIKKKETYSNKINRYLKSLLSQILTYRSCYRYDYTEQVIDLSIARYRDQWYIQVYHKSLRYFYTVKQKRIKICFLLACLFNRNDIFFFSKF